MAVLSRVTLLAIVMLIGITAVANSKRERGTATYLLKDRPTQVLAQGVSANLAICTAQI